MSAFKLCGRVLLPKMQSIKLGHIMARRYSKEIPDWKEHQEQAIGNREQIGYGFNGQPCYVDRSDFPFPSIRFMETTPEIQALREKEKGDWRLLTREEKKAIYRSNFCQTFTEFKAPTGEWKTIVGAAIFFVSLGIWLYIWMVVCVYNRYPKSFSDENKKAQMRRQIDLHMNPITGLSSVWDYDAKDWKVKSWNTPPNPFKDKKGNYIEEVPYTEL